MDECLASILVGCLGFVIALRALHLMEEGS